MILAKRRAEQKRREAANRPPPSPPVPHLVPRHILQQTVEKLRREHELEVRALNDTIKELRAKPSDGKPSAADFERMEAAYEEEIGRLRKRIGELEGQLTAEPEPEPEPNADDPDALAPALEAEAETLAEQGKDELTDQAKEVGVAVRGSKIDIARRIVLALNAPPAQPADG